MARSRASDFEEKQHSLLLTAAHVFATTGMEKASMSQIASEAGVSKSLLYHYYPSKGALIFAIIMRHLSDLDAKLELAHDPGLNPEQRLERLVATVLNAYRGADDHHKVQLNAAPALTPEQAREITQLERGIVRRFSTVIGEMFPDLERSERPLLMPVTMSLFGMLNWAYMWFRDGGSLTREEYARIATTILLQGVKGIR